MNTKISGMLLIGMFLSVTLSAQVCPFEVSLQNVNFPEDYISITQGPATVVLTFQLCNDGAALSENQQQLFELNVGSTLLQIDSFSNTQAGNWFAHDTSNNDYLAIQIADIPAASCADVTIYYSVVQDTEDGSGPLSTGLNCVQLNIQPPTADVAQDNACRDESDDQIQLCTHTREGTILPLQLLSFDAHLINDESNLSWATAFEDNVSHFEVQRSSDGVGFSTLGNKQSSGGLLSGAEYQFIDKSPFAGSTFYRLRMIDLDGAFDFSPIREVRTEEADRQEVNAFPNPADAHLKVQTAFEFSGKMSIYNAMGQLMKQLDTEEMNGSKYISTQDLANGVYFLKAQSEGHFETITFEVLHR